MKKLIIMAAFCSILALTLCVSWGNAESKWQGVDDTVVGKFAEQAGRPPREPFLNFGGGDIELFLFLIAGSVGGFVAGYYYRDLFVPGSGRVKNPSNV
jgi:ABC-type cobalt transport system substrate-binding protein